MKIKTSSLLIIYTFTALLFYSCRTTTDTVQVVEDRPRAETTEEVEEVEEEFHQLTIGLIDPVNNFDPLFARNLSSNRVLSLIYNGLFELDTNGEPIPALASEVTISDDGLEYIIRLDRNNFYHESEIFTAGVGRRIHARDIKFVFERSAKSHVPPMAANLLMNVRGFENYYLEQRSVYDERYRVLDGVNGIQVIDAETLRIQLLEEDPDFLYKLASPHLFIYPHEALRRSEEGLFNQPVGTGPYVFNRIDENRNIVLIRNDSENLILNNGDRPQVNRIDFRYFSTETDLFQEFSRGTIDWIPESGPEITNQVIDNDYRLIPTYEDDFTLTEHNCERITAFYLNNRSVANKEWLKNRLALLTEEDLSLRGNITLQTADYEFIEGALPNEEYYISYTDNYVAHALLVELHNLVFQPESSLVFFDIRVPTRRTSIYTQSGDSYQQQVNAMDNDYWLRIDTKILSLHKDHVDGIQTSTVPWGLHINNIRVRDREVTP